MDLYITYTKFYKFLFLVSILLGFKIINWLKTSLSRLLNRLVGQARCRSSLQKKPMTGNELSSSFVYSTQGELKPSKAWLGLTHFHPYMWRSLLFSWLFGYGGYCVRSVKGGPSVWMSGSNYLGLGIDI